MQEKKKIQEFLYFCTLGNTGSEENLCADKVSLHVPAHVPVCYLNVHL